MAAFNFPQDAKFLLIRPDKIGDVLLTTPAVASLRRRYPQSHIAFLCRSYTAPLLENNPDISLVIKEDEHSFFALAGKIKELNFDAAMHFFVETRTVLAARAAAVPVRIGPMSKLAALFLNHRVTQNRSRAEKHEAEYNLDLVKICGADGKPAAPKLFLTDAEKSRGKEIVLSTHAKPGQPPIIIHPGSAGSVQNWPLEHFLKLALKIAENIGEVIFTAGRGEENIIEAVKSISHPPHPYIHTIPAGSLTLRELAAVIANSKMMISNSTGPLHMASALGIPTLSFYPHIPKVTSAKRWGPFGDDRLNQVLSPASERAPMSAISVETAFQRLLGGPT